jgi:phosphoribosylformimino-5-aminoimidazole carboxamide ribotide isomerase
LLDAIARALEPGSLVVAIDTRDAMPANRRGPIAGSLTPAMMAKRAVDLGVPNVIYRDLGSDGSLAGAPIREAAALIPAGPRVIVAGGVGGLDDLRAAAHAGLSGVIVGRALYENRFSLQQALACSG